MLLYQEGTSHVTPLVIDFGVGKISMAKTKTNYKDSTYMYLAPEEQKEGEHAWVGHLAWPLDSKAPCCGQGRHEKLLR